MKRGRYRTGERAGIWLAITLAAFLHTMVLLLPVTGKNLPADDLRSAIEIELTTVAARPPEPMVPEPEIETDPSESVVEQLTGSPPPPAATPPLQPTIPPPAVAGMPASGAEHEFDNLSELDKDLLTSTILARQYFTEESAVDRLFGKPLVQDSSDFQKEFHYPLRKDLLEMLDRPLPDLPFEYTPGLVYFAYDAGLKGDLQRFWDVITPEFGWRTRYGTEVKCALVLVIVGCVWK